MLNCLLNLCSCGLKSYFDQQRYDKIGVWLVRAQKALLLSFMCNVGIFTGLFLEGLWITGTNVVIYISILLIVLAYLFELLFIIKGFRISDQRDMETIPEFKTIHTFYVFLLWVFPVFLESHWIVKTFSLLTSKGWLIWWIPKVLLLCSLIAKAFVILTVQTCFHMALKKHYSYMSYEVKPVDPAISEFSPEYPQTKPVESLYPTVVVQVQTVDV
jgi:hypothetical protein